MIDFPSNPVVGQPFAVGDKKWKWNGVGWKLAGRVGTSGGEALVASGISPPELLADSTNTDHVYSS